MIEGNQLLQHFVTKLMTHFVHVCISPNTEGELGAETIDPKRDVIPHIRTHFPLNCDPLIRIPPEQEGSSLCRRNSLPCAIS